MSDPHHILGSEASDVGSDPVLRLISDVLACCNALLAIRKQESQNASRDAEDQVKSGADKLADRLDSPCDRSRPVVRPSSDLHAEGWLSPWEDLCLNGQVRDKEPGPVDTESDENKENIPPKEGESSAPAPPQQQDEPQQNTLTYALPLAFHQPNVLPTDRLTKDSNARQTELTSRLLPPRYEDIVRRKEGNIVETDVSQTTIKESAATPYRLPTTNINFAKMTIAKKKELAAIRKLARTPTPAPPPAPPPPPPPPTPPPHIKIELKDPENYEVFQLMFKGKDEKGHRSGLAGVSTVEFITAMTEAGFQLIDKKATRNHVHFKGDPDWEEPELNVCVHPEHGPGKDYEIPKGLLETKGKDITDDSHGRIDWSSIELVKRTPKSNTEKK